MKCFNSMNGYLQRQTGKKNSKKKFHKSYSLIFLLFITANSIIVGGSILMKRTFLQELNGVYINARVRCCELFRQKQTVESNLDIESVVVAVFTEVLKEL